MSEDLRLLDDETLLDKLHLQLILMCNCRPAERLAHQERARALSDEVGRRLKRNPRCPLCGVEKTLCSATCNPCSRGRKENDSEAPQAIHGTEPEGSG